MKSRVKLIEASNLGEAVAVVESLKLSRAKLGRDVAARRQSVPGRGGNLNFLAILDEVLRKLVLLEASDDTDFAKRLQLASPYPSHKVFSEIEYATYVNFLEVSTVFPLP